MNTQANLKFVKEQKVKFSHCDMAGVVFYPKFLEMLNELVEDWFDEALEYSFARMLPNKGVPTVDIKVSFKSPARLGKVLQKTLWVEVLSDRSVTYGFNFAHKDSVILEGTSVLVNVALDKTNQQIAPQDWNEAVKNKMQMYLKE